MVTTFVFGTLKLLTIGTMHIIQLRIKIIFQRKKHMQIKDVLKENTLFPTKSSILNFNCASHHAKCVSICSSYVAGFLIKKLQDFLSLSAWGWCHCPHMSTSANHKPTREGPRAWLRPLQVQFSEQDWTALNNGWKLKKSYKETPNMKHFYDENVQQSRRYIIVSYYSVVLCLKNGVLLSFYTWNTLKNTVAWAAHSFWHLVTNK